MENSFKENERNITRRRASRTHQGSGHWHVEKRSSVIICGNCHVRIPKWKNPQFCPECDAGHNRTKLARATDR